MINDKLRVILSFRKMYRFLSNFYPSPVFLNRQFATAEHAYQFLKADVANDQVMAQNIARIPTPAEAKNLGETVCLHEDWTRVLRFSAMEQVLRAKFTPGTEMARLLALTGDSLLIEGNHHHDNDWGVCFCPSCPGIGHNYLGQMLMTIRSELHLMEEMSE